MRFKVFGSTGSGRAGIYTATSPATLLVESDVANIPVTETAIYAVSMTSNVYLPAGDYYLALMVQGNEIDFLHTTYHWDNSKTTYRNTNYLWGPLPTTIIAGGVNWFTTSQYGLNIEASVGCP